MGTVKISNDKPLDQTVVNSWEDTEFLEAVRATGRWKLIFWVACGRVRGPDDVPARRTVTVGP